MLLEKRAPFVVQKHTVGLYRVQDLLTRFAVPLYDIHRAPEEVESHESRLAALPGDGDLGRVLRFEQLTDVRLHCLVGHAETLAGVETFLGEEEAVCAIEIADGAGRLRENMQGWQWIIHMVAPFVS